MAAQEPVANVIPPPPRLTGQPQQDTIAIIQWINSLYTVGILGGGLLQSGNFDGTLDQTMLEGYPALLAISALASAADQFAYYTGKDTVALTALSPFMRTLLAAEDATAAKAILGIP